MRHLAIGLGGMLLSACSTLMPPKPPEFKEVQLPLAAEPVRKGRGGGVFVTDTPWTLTSDSRAFRSGDVLTITLDESTQASKKANTKFDKSSGVDIAPAIIAQKKFRTDASLSASQNFAGDATSSQQNALQGSISVIVTEVLPNGLLKIQGDKSLYLNQGEEIIHVSGYVRASDIDTDNRVSSQRIANARISYSGQGTLADSNTAGWLLRFFVGLMAF
jgi:flagellar L-ring protein precursor FlgH